MELILSATSRNPRSKILKSLHYSDLSPMASFEKFGWNRALFAQIELPKDPLILNIGGFMGDSTQFLQDLYGGQIHVVEPIPQYISTLKKRFSNNKNIKIIPMAVGARDSEIELKMQDDLTGIFATGNTTIKVKCININNLLEKLDKKPDLIVMNIEGGEFEVLESMNLTRRTSHYPFLCLQFHNVFPEAVARRENIRTKLSRNHKELINFPWVWEVWRGKE